MPIATPSTDSAARSRPAAQPDGTDRAAGRRRAAGTAGRRRRVTAGSRCRARRGRRAARPGGAWPPATVASWVMTTMRGTRPSLSSRSSARMPAPVARVEVAGRLVGQHQRRPADERPGDGHPLALPAGQQPGRGARRGAPSPTRSSASARRPGARAGRYPAVQQAGRHVVPAAVSWSSRKNCWNTTPSRCARSPDSRPVGQVLDRLAGDAHRTRRRPVQPGREVEQRRLARTGRARPRPPTLHCGRSG